MLWPPLMIYVGYAIQMRKCGDKEKMIKNWLLFINQNQKCSKVNDLTMRLFILLTLLISFRSYFSVELVFVSIYTGTCKRMKKKKNKNETNRHQRNIKKEKKTHTHSIKSTEELLLLFIINNNNNILRIFEPRLRIWNVFIVE